MMLNFILFVIVLSNYINYVKGQTMSNTFCENPNEYNGLANVHSISGMNFTCDDILPLMGLSNIDVNSCSMNPTANLYSSIYGSFNTSLSLYTPASNHPDYGSTPEFYQYGGCCRDGKPLCRNYNVHTFCKNSNQYNGDAIVVEWQNGQQFTCNQWLSYIQFDSADTSCINNAVLEFWSSIVGGPSEQSIFINDMNNATIRGGCCLDNQPKCDGNFQGNGNTTTNNNHNNNNNNNNNTTTTNNNANFCKNPLDFLPNKIAMEYVSPDNGFKQSMTCDQIISLSGGYSVHDVCEDMVFSTFIFGPYGTSFDANGTIFHGGCCGNGKSICHGDTNFCKNPDKFQPNHKAIIFNHNGPYLNSSYLNCDSVPKLFGYTNSQTCNNIDTANALNFISSNSISNYTANGMTLIPGCCSDGLSVCFDNDNNNHPNFTIDSIPMCKNSDLYKSNAIGMISDDGTQSTCDMMKHTLVNYLSWPSDIEPTQENFCKHMYGSFIYMELKRASSNVKSYAADNSIFTNNIGGCCDDGLFLCDEPKDKYQGICSNENSYDGNKRAYYAYGHLIDHSSASYRFDEDNDDDNNNNNRRLKDIDDTFKVLNKFTEKMSNTMKSEIDRNSDESLISAYNHNERLGKLIKSLQRRELTLTKLHYLAMKNQQILKKSDVNDNGRKLYDEENYLGRTAPYMSCNEIIKFIYNEYSNKTTTPIYSTNDQNFCSSDHEFLSFMELIANPLEIIYDVTQSDFSSSKLYWPHHSIKNTNRNGIPYVPNKYLKNNNNSNYNNTNQIPIHRSYSIGGCCNKDLYKCHDQTKPLYNPKYNTICQNPNSYQPNYHAFKISNHSRFDTLLPGGWLTCNEFLYTIGNDIINFDDPQWCKNAVLDDELKTFLLYSTNNFMTNYDTLGFQTQLGGCCNDGLITQQCDFKLDDLDFPYSSVDDDDDNDNDNDDINNHPQSKNRPSIFNKTSGSIYSSKFQNFFVDSPYSLNENQIKKFSCKSKRDKLDIITNIKNIHINKNPITNNINLPLIAMNVHYEEDMYNMMPNGYLKSIKTGHIYDTHDAILKIKLRRKSNQGKIKSKDFMLSENYFYDSINDNHVYLSPSLPSNIQILDGQNILDDIHMLRMDLKVADKNTGKYRSVACAKFEIPMN